MSDPHQHLDITPLTVAPTARSVAHLCMKAEPGTMQCDVVVVGTGAGGAVAGTEFAKAGKKVIFLEAGGAYAAKDFSVRSLPWALTTLWASKGTQSSSTLPVALVPSARVVGGTTVINSGICFRPPATRLKEWQDLTASTFFSPEHLDPFVDEIWRRVGVMPTHAGIGRRNNSLFQKGCEALGYTHAWMDRNAPGCLGCGVCLTGCPSGGKASVDKAILPEALNHGARIYTRARVKNVLLEGGRATGVVVDCIDEREHITGTLTVKADVVIVAGGALFSPLLLKSSGIQNQHLGRHLAIHPGIGSFGFFKEPVVMWDGVPQGYYAYCPTDENALLETANAGPSELFALLGKAGDVTSAQQLKHLSMAGAMIRDSGGGTVDIDVGDGDDAGVVRPRFALQFTERDLQAFRSGCKATVSAWFAAGAEKVMPGLQPTRWCTSEQEAHDLIDTLHEASQLGQPYGSHPHGTCRMGPKEGPNAGVVDDHGAVHGTSGLYVMDGSVFPSTLGVNPQITIMSTALALARQLV